MSSSFVPLFFHKFSGYDFHLIFEQLSIQAFKMRYKPKIFPKSTETYVSVQVGCLRFLDSYRFLSRSLDKLVKSINSFPITQSVFGMESNNFTDDLLKEKLAYPYEYFNLSNFQEPLNLTEESFWSTLKQETPPDEEINRTQEVIKKFNIKNGQELFMLYLKMDFFQLADVFEIFIEKSTLMYGNNPLYSYSAPSYTRKAGLKSTNMKLDFIKYKNFFIVIGK